MKLVETSEGTFAVAYMTDEEVAEIREHYNKKKEQE
jgi:hypothetical protein